MPPPDLPTSTVGPRNWTQEAGQTLETIELADGGLLLYDRAFLPPELADRYLVELRDHCAWVQMPGVFGHMQPRLTASYGDEGVTHRYSGTVNVALPWTPALLEIKQKIEAIQGQYNYCLLNRYRSGQDSMGRHADDEPEMGNVIGCRSRFRTGPFSRSEVSQRELPGGAYGPSFRGGFVGSVDAVGLALQLDDGRTVDHAIQQGHGQGRVAEVFGPARPAPTPGHPAKMARS